MYAIMISDDLWKTILTYLAALSWPIIVLVIVCIFKNPLSKLIANLKTAKWKDLIFEFDDRIPVYSPKDKKIRVGIVQPPPPSKVLKMAAIEISLLPQKEIDRSRERAEARIKEDTERVGYRRGKPYQLPNGKWAIAWELELSSKIGIKDSLK